MASAVALTITVPMIDSLPSAPTPSSPHTSPSTSSESAMSLTPQAMPSQQQSFYCPEPTVCPSTPAAHQTFLPASPSIRRVTSRPSSPPSPTSSTSSSLSASSSSSSSSTSSSTSPSSSPKRRPDQQLSARTRRVYIKECKELRTQIRGLQQLSDPCSSPPHMSSPHSLASLQDRYSRRKHSIRQSAATAIQAAWRGYKARKTYTTKHRREMMASTAAADTHTMDVDSHLLSQPPLQPQQQQEAEKDQQAGADVAESAGAGLETPQSASERMEVIVSMLVTQREADDTMRQAVEMWTVRELEKEKVLLKSLLMKESQARQHRRASSSPADTATEDGELRTVFAPLYAHYRHLQSLLAKNGGGMKPQVPLFHSTSDASNSSQPLTPLSSPHSAFSLVKPQPMSPRAEKRALQVKLAEYTRQFTATHGRAIQSADDIAPVKDDWARYKYLKFTLSDKGQSSGINRRVVDRVNGTTTPERKAAAGVRGHRKSASMSTVPTMGAALSSAFSAPLSRAQSAASQPASPRSPHSPATPSTLPTQPNTPSTPTTPSTPMTPASNSSFPFASLYTSIPQFPSPSLLSSLPSPSHSPSHTPMLPPSPISPYSPAQSYPHSPYSQYGPYSPMGNVTAMSGMSVGGSFGGYLPLYPQQMTFGTPVLTLQPHFNAVYDGNGQANYPTPAPGWC